MANASAVAFTRASSSRCRCGWCGPSKTPRVGSRHRGINRAASPGCGPPPLNPRGWLAGCGHGRSFGLHFRGLNPTFLQLMSHFHVTRGRNLGLGSAPRERGMTCRFPATIAPSPLPGVSPFLLSAKVRTGLAAVPRGDLIRPRRASRKPGHVRWFLLRLPQSWVRTASPTLDYILRFRISLPTLGFLRRRNGPDASTQAGGVPGWNRAAQLHMRRYLAVWPLCEENRYG